MSAETYGTVPSSLKWSAIAALPMVSLVKVSAVMICKGFVPNSAEDVVATAVSFAVTAVVAAAVIVPAQCLVWNSLVAPAFKVPRIGFWHACLITLVGFNFLTG